MVPAGSTPRPAQTLEDWTRVYDSLSDEEIDAVDKVAKTRANLTRNLPLPMDEALLDTDILSEVLKRKDQHVLSTAQQYLAEHQRLAFSAMTVYEIIRGLRANQATRALAEFIKTVGTSDVFLRQTLLPAAERLVRYNHGNGSGHAILPPPQREQPRPLWWTWPS